jgi:hypothetical protein
MIEKVVIWIAWHLPKEIAKWCYVRVAVNSTYKRPDIEVGAISIMDALGDWEK